MHTHTLPYTLNVLCAKVNKSWHWYSVEVGRITVNICSCDGIIKAYTYNLHTRTEQHKAYTEFSLLPNDVTSQLHTILQFVCPLIWNSLVFHTTSCTLHDVIWHFSLFFFWFISIFLINNKFQVLISLCFVCTSLVLTKWNETKKKKKRGTLNWLTFYFIFRQIHCITKPRIQEKRWTFLFVVFFLSSSSSSHYLYWSSVGCSVTPRNTLTIKWKMFVQNL